MLLTVDVGNTSCKFGIFDGNKEISLVYYDNVKDNYRSLILSTIYKANLREDAFDSAILSCVVPNVYNEIYDALESVIGKGKVIDIDAHNYYGLVLDADPNEVGDDLIVMSAYAYGLYKQELIIVSIGTCSVLCHVSKEGVFSHCIIAPGFANMNESIWSSAAQLNKVEISKPDNFLANTTSGAIKIGAFEGYIGMLSYLIDGLASDIGSPVKIIACGGLGKMFTPYLPQVEEYEPDFVSKGLQYIYSKYEKH